MSINIVIKQESCDNLLNQTVEFLQAINSFKKTCKVRFNVELSKDTNLKQHYAVIGDTVIWGTRDIVMFLDNKFSKPQEEGFKQKQYEINDGSKFKHVIDIKEHKAPNTNISDYQKFMLTQGDEQDEREEMGTSNLKQEMDRYLENRPELKSNEHMREEPAAENTQPTEEEQPTMEQEMNEEVMQQEQMPVVQKKPKSLQEQMAERILEDRGED